MCRRSLLYLLFILLLCSSGMCLNYSSSPAADFTGDRAVNFPDYAGLASAWRTEVNQPDFNSVYDLYADNVIDLKDLDVFVQYWLWQPAATHREKINFNTGWKFYKGAISGDEANKPDYNDSSSSWYNVTVPHNPPMDLNNPDPVRPAWSSYSYEGVSWYRKHFTIDSFYREQGRKIFIEFEAANTVADVWINGTYLTTHYGGYLPFTVDVTDYLNFGATENVIAVKVDNTYNADVPPGESGWFNWPGIYRDVWMHITDKLHVTDAVDANKVAGGGIFVTYPDVNVSQAHIQIKTNVKNEYGAAKNCTVKTYLLNANNQIVDTNAMSDANSIASGADCTFTQTATVNNPNLWHPDHPYLYTVSTEVYDDNTLVDTYRTRIGIRKISFTKAGGFKINGETLRFMGANRMQDYPYVGYAMSNYEQRRDAVLLKEAGFQYVRTAHYPQDPAFMEACDELGLMVMDSIPGFQNWSNTTAFKNNSYQNMRDMIRRDRNHACVIAWELSLNESGFSSTYATNAVNIGHAEYPGDQCFVAGWLFDNIYNVFIATPKHLQDLYGVREYTGSKPFIISEYGEYEYGGTSNVHRATWLSGGYSGEAAMLQQAWNHQEGLYLNRGLSNMCGDGLWVGFDYGPYPQGIIDKLRVPKFSHYFFRSQRAPNLIIPDIDSGPMVYIANYWTSTSPHDVNVFSNCDQVKLYINDVNQGIHNPNTGYPNSNLLHPPFSFTGLTWASGELKAEGYIGGNLVATHIVRTPGTANSIVVSFDASEMVADGSDIIFAYASVVDANGTIVPGNSSYITFNVTGPAALVSPSIVRAEAGISTALLRSSTRPGQVTVAATATGLSSGNASINSIMGERVQD